MYKNLKILRERLGLTQKELATLINVSRPVYTQYENEYTTIPLTHLITICNYFNVSLDYIFAFTLTKNYPHFNTTLNRSLAGTRLKEFRHDYHLTQEKLASYLNTTHSVISDYEKGRFLISTSFLYTICLKYQISADYLIGRTNTNNKDNLKVSI